MSDSAKFEHALDRLTSALKDVFLELHSTPPAVAAVPAAVIDAPPAPVIIAAPAGPGTAPLCTGFERVLSAANQGDIMQALLDGTSAYAGRSAVLVVKGDRLAGWRGRGFNEAGLAGLRGLNLAGDGDGGWRQPMSSDGSLSKEVSDAFTRNLGNADGNSYLIPLLVRDRPVAMLYADGDVDAGALRLLARTAGIRLEIMSGGAAKPAAAAPAPVPVAAAPAPVAAPVQVAAPAPVVVPEPVVAAPPPPPPPPPAPRKVSGPDLTNVPAEDQESHKKAFRFAKLLVDELMLYNKDKVVQGKQQKDVYALLQEDIDKSRLAYEKKFSATPAAKVDYFHQQMVQIIGDGDPKAIGSGYPGPLV